MTQLRLFLLSFVFLLVGNLWGQVLPVKSKDIINLFLTSQGNFQWNFPVSAQDQVPIVWIERKNSFSKKGIRTFIGYQQHNFQAVVSVSQDYLSGTILLMGKEYQLYTDSQGMLAIRVTKEPKPCGNCKGSGWGMSKPLEFNSHISEPLMPLSAFTLPNHQYFADDVLRIYRLAMPITYECFSQNFNSSTDLVHVFWAQMETALNEIYVRDISVKFEIVQDDRLIIQTSQDPINRATYRRTASEIIRNATDNINQIITEQSYDVGIVIGKNKDLIEAHGEVAGLLGLAGVGSAYTKSYKAQAIAIDNLQTIAHEIGHLFGARHTFDGNNALKTEVGQGQSLMSYGLPMNFFSLPSIGHDIKPILARMPYYSDRARTQLEKFPFYYGGYLYSNATYGVKTSNKAPVLDKSKLQREYIIPQGTFFQFYLSATDPDNQPLYYMVNQADIKEQESSIAKFLTFPASSNANVTFQTSYDRKTEGAGYDVELLEEVPHSTPSAIGNFTFWLAVRDSDLRDVGREDHATSYDIAKTKVKIVSGPPFKMTNTFEKKYKARDKILLKWKVDSNVFSKNSKVRILLSDDFGQTFNYVLNHSTDNDGECEVVLPNIAIGKKRIWYPSSNYSVEVPAGIIKIEVIDQLAYDVSATRPFSIKVDRRGNIKINPLGGFVLEKSPIDLTHLPAQEVTLPCSDLDNIPQTIIPNSTCQGRITSNYREEGRLAYCQAYSYMRIWTFTDTCGNEAVFRQKVRVIPSSIKLENLPAAQITLSCSELDDIPQGIIAKSECTGVVTKTYTEENRRVDCEKYSYTRVWTFTDACGNHISFRQEVQVIPQLELGDNLPQNQVVSCNAIPIATPTIHVVGGCAPLSVQYMEDKQEQQCEKTYTIRRTWIVTDDCNQQVIHHQLITIVPEEKIYNYVVFDSPSNYFKVSGIDIDQITIFDSMGLKVFEASNYGKNAEVFRGFSNVKGTLNRNKKLPSGTYFYILTYREGQHPKNKSGYLYLQ